MSFSVSRSLKRCFADAWRIFALSWSGYVSYNLIYCLAGGLGVAFLLEVLTRYVAGNLVPAMMLRDAGVQLDLVRFIALPDGVVIVTALAFALVAFVGFCVAQGRLAALMHRFDRRGRLPGVSARRLLLSDRSVTLRAVGRLMATDALAFVVLGAVAAGVGFVAVKYSGWLWLLLLPIFAYWSMVWHIARTERVVFDRPFSKAWGRAFKYHFKHYGTLMIVQFVSFCVVLLPAVIMLLPFAVYVCDVCATSVSLMANDVALLPAWLGLLQFVINTFAFAFLLLLGGVARWAFVMKLGTYK